MWRADAPWLLVLAADRVELGRARRGAAGVQPIACVPISALEGASALDALAAAVATSVRQAASTASAATRAGLHALVSERWMHVAVLPWRGHDAADETQLREQMRQLGFDVQAGDRLCIDRGGYGEPCIAAAYPAPVLQAIAAAAQALRAPLRSLLPLGAAAAEGARRHGAAGAVAIAEGGATQLCRLDRRKAWPIAMLQAKEDLTSAWRRARARDAALASNATLHVVDVGGVGDMASGPGLSALSWPALRAASPALALACESAAFRHRFDAVPRAPWGSPAWGALAAIATCTALWAGMDASRTGAAARQAEVRAVAAPSRPADETPAWTAADTARVRAVNAAVRELNLPFGAMLRGLLPPRDIAADLVSLEVVPPAGAQIASSGARIKLVALAPSMIDMSRYVSLLAGRPAFASAYLVQHEAREGGGVRFTVDVVARP